MSSLIVSCRDNIWHSTNFIAMVGLRDKANRQFQGPIILGFFWAAPEVHNQESLNTFSRNERQLHEYYPPHNYQSNVFKCIYIFFFFLFKPFSSFISLIMLILPGPLCSYNYSQRRLPCTIYTICTRTPKENTFLPLSPHVATLTFDSHGPLIVTKSSSSVRLLMTSTVLSDTHLCPCTYNNNNLIFTY